MTGAKGTRVAVVGSIPLQDVRRPEATATGVELAVLSGPWVARDRLVATLLASPARVAVVSGPAGSGKSTLAQQWLERESRRYVTVALTAAHDDAVLLARALTDAFGELGPRSRSLRAALTASEPDFSAVVLPSLARIASTRRDAFVLVVDDAHLVTSAGGVAVLRAITTHVPEGSTVALLTRSATPTWLAATRSRGDLLEIGPRALAFDRDETDHLLRAFGLPSQTGDDLDQVEGWAVGLYLTALARSREDSTDAPLVNGDDRYVRDYLHAEIIDTEDEAHRDLLVAAALLEVIEPAVCDAMLERHDSAERLDSLARRIQLLVPAGPGSLRLHHLLRDALRANAALTQPQYVAVLRTRAARWYFAGGRVEEAVAHAKASGDLNLLGEIVWSQVVDCLASGHPDDLRRWLGGVPERELESQPHLSLAMLWLTVQTGEMGLFERWMIRAEAHAGRDWTERTASSSYAAWLAIVEALVGHRGLDESRRIACAAFEDLPADDRWRAVAAWLGGMSSYLSGDVPRSTHLMHEAERLGRALDVPQIEVESLAWQAVLRFVDGDVQGACSLLSPVPALMHRHAIDKLSTAAHALTALALAQAVMRDSAAATTLATARRRTEEISGIAPWFQVTGRLVQARTAVALGDGALARQLMNEARARITPDLRSTLVQRLLDDAEESMRTMVSDGVSPAALTSAELRVLQFLPSHLSFPQIGQHLFLSGNTVKTHAMSIYRKLGVRSRTDAVARAESLGLVEPPLLG